MSFETRDGMSRDELLGMVTEEIRYFRELRRGIRNLDMNVTAQRRQSRGVVHDLRAKAAAARSTAIVPFAKQEQKQNSPQKKPPLRPKRVVQVEEEKHPTMTPPPPRDPPPPKEKKEEKLSPSARELRRISESFKSGAIDLEQKRALKQKLIRAVSPRHHVVQDEKTSDVDAAPTRRMSNSSTSRKKKKVTVVRPFRFATASRRRRGVVGAGDAKKKKEKRRQRKQKSVLEGETKVETRKQRRARPPIPRPTTGDSRKVFEEEEDVGSSGDYTEVN